MTDPLPQFSHFVTALKERHPKLAYLHLVEPRISGSENRTVGNHESNDILREIWQPLPYISAGGYLTREDAIQVAEQKGGLIAFGRMYISNVSLFALNQITMNRN
jgi:NADPH2 dehydrogenase